ncbi:LOW QUALITY PROTEIN: tetratricopeptide repeat protein 41-like [Discoglossus pictus]
MPQSLDCSSNITPEDHYYHFTCRPPLQPYVCSTSNDLQEEKHYLAKNIFPQLNHICFGRGTLFKAIDLRWPAEEVSKDRKSTLPAQTTHVSSEKLKMSLDYIDITAPFFICILGHRYGEFVPENYNFSPGTPDAPDFSAFSQVEQNLIVAANSGYPWVLEDSNRKCSLTELEIIQAAFLRDCQFQFFYFRDYDYIEKRLQEANKDEREMVLSTLASENEYEESKVWELKVKIVDKGLPVRFFRTKEELGRLILKDWQEVIEKQYPIAATPTIIGHEHNLGHAYNEAFAESLCKNVVPTEQSRKLFLVLNAFVSGAVTNKQSSHLKADNTPTRSKSDSRSIFLLNGERGCGKSTLVAEWLNSFRPNNPHITVISYFVGSSGKSIDITAFMQHCITELQCEYFGQINVSNGLREGVLLPEIHHRLFVLAICLVNELAECVVKIGGLEGRNDPLIQRLDKQSSVGWLEHYFHWDAAMELRQVGIPHEELSSREDLCDIRAFPLIVEAFIAAIALKPCVLLLDGVDELSAIRGVPAEQAKGFTWLPPNLPPHCKIIITANNSHLSNKYLMGRSDVQVAELVKISDEGTRMSIFEKHVAVPDKYISSAELKGILNQKRKISPLQIAILASELRMFSMYTDKSQCLENYLDALSVEQLWSFVIQRWVTDYSWTCERPRKGKRKKASLACEANNTVLTEMDGWVVDVLCLLSISRCGLDDHDILQLLKMMGYQDNFEVTSLHWANFRLATSKWIRDKPDGLLHFHHRSVRDAVEHLLLGVVLPLNESLDNSFQKSMNRKRKHFHELLIKYFQQMNFSRRVYEELPWHLKMIGNLNELYRFLSNTRTLNLISMNMQCGSQMKMDLIHYWQILSESGKDPAVEYEIIISNLTDGRIDECCNVIDLCRIMCFAAKCLKDIGRTNEAENIFLSIEAQLLKSAPNSSTTEVILWTQKCIGDLCRDVGSCEEGFNYYQKALNNLKCLDSGGKKNSNKLLQLKVLVRPAATTTGSNRLMKALSETKHILFSLGDFSEAEKCLCECFYMRCKLYGKKHILTAEVQEHLADLQSHPRNNQYSHRIRALDNYKAVIEIKEASEALLESMQVKKHLRLSLSNTLFKAGKLLNLNDLGGSKDATVMFQRSLDLRTSIVGLDHPLSQEVQCYLKKMNGRRSSKTEVGYEKADHFQRPKSVKHYRKFYNCPSVTCNEDTKCNRTATLELMNLPHQNECATDDSVSRYSRNQEQTKQIQYAQVEGAALLIEENNNSAQSTTVNSFLKFAGNKHASEKSCIKSIIVHRPVSVHSTLMTGPLSSIQSLVPLNRPKSCSDKFTFIHKSAWYHVPGRYATLETPLPPKRNQMREEF